MFFLFILIILLILGIAIYTIRVAVEVENLIIDTERPKGEKVNKESKIFISISVFKKIILFKKDIRNMDKKNIKFKNKDLDIKFFKNRDIKVDYKDLIEEINKYFEKIDLQVQLGTEDAALTAILTGIIASGLGVILRKPKYEVIPIYSNKNFIKIKLDCIFSVHLMQYINKVILDKKNDFKNNNLENNNLGSEFLNRKVEV